MVVCRGRNGGALGLRLLLGGATFGIIYWLLGTFQVLRREGFRNRLRLVLAAMAALWVTGMVLVPH